MSRYNVYWYTDAPYCGHGCADSDNVTRLRAPVWNYRENLEASDHLFRDEFGMLPDNRDGTGEFFEIVSVPDDVSHDHDIHEMNVALIADLYDRI